MDGKNINNMNRSDQTKENPCKLTLGNSMGILETIISIGPFLFHLFTGY